MIRKEDNKSLIFAIVVTLNTNDKFCSVCSVYAVIDRIYKLSIYECVNSCRVKIPGADIFVNNIEKISSTSIVGAQQDPFEFLTFLLDHLIQCLSSKKCFVNEKSNNSIQHLFGINIRRRSQCQIYSNEHSSTTWKSVLAISIDDYTHLTTAIKAFFKEELLTNENLYECDQCKEKVPGTTKLDIAKVSPIIFIHLRKFTFDESIEMVTKIYRFISFPEILN